LAFQCSGNFFVHATHNVNAAGVFFAGALHVHKRLNVVGKLHYVYLVRDEGILAGAVALKKDLLDSFFT
jgi:hypothetical protein